MTQYLILIGLLVAPSAHSAMYRWKFFDGTTVGDLEQKFAVGDWNCTVGPAVVTKELPNKETRKLGCGVGKGLQAFTYLICGIDKVIQRPSGEVGFDLEMKKAASSYVRLSCE